jgi:hypothetical protein
MSLPYNPNSIPYGSRILTINSVAYIANNFRVNNDADILERKTELGAPNGFIMLRKPYTGTAELQLANTAIAFPNISLTFSAFVSAENANLNFAISGTGNPEVQDQIKLCDITFREVI